MTKLCFISDTHTYHNKLTIPECDVLIHAGDWTFKGSESEVRDFAEWLESLDQVGDIILTPGNHEVAYSRAFPDSINWIKDHCPRAHVLNHESLILRDINFFFSPFTPAFGFGWAYNAGRTPVEAAHLFKPFLGDLWVEIPEATEILVTHGMPYGILDDALDFHLGKITSVGDRELLKRCQSLSNLKHVVGGHLHANGGKSLLQDGVWYHNAAVLDDQYRLRNQPIVIEI